MTLRAEFTTTAGDLLISVDLHATQRDDGTYTPIALIGPNGSGKSTILRALSGAHRATSGSAVVHGKPWFDIERGLEIPVESRHVGYVPQGSKLFAHLSVLDNVAFALSVGANKRPRGERREAALRILTELQCGDLATRSTSTLSGGEQQRVALARALLRKPELLLLDEPLAALDASMRRSVRQYLADRLRALRKPSVVVTHDARDVVALDAHIMLLERGVIVQQGTYAEFIAAPATEFAIEFFAITPPPR